MSRWTRRELDRLRKEQARQRIRDRALKTAKPTDERTQREEQPTVGIKVKTTETPEFEPIEPGEYRAKVTEIQEEPEGLYGPQIRFTFEVTGDEDYEGETLFGWAALKHDRDSGEPAMWPGTKLYEWVWAISGGGKDMVEDLEELVGKPCRIMVKTKEKKDGTLTNRIESVLPPKKGKGRSQEQPKEEEPEIPEEMESAPF